jgi:hypothetical protein
MSILLDEGGIILNTGGIISNRGGVIITDGLDANAAAYIAAVKATGATVTPARRTFINNFYADAKEVGYYPSMKRIVFPIWEVAAANAIDMITLASGVYNGGVTHGAGFVKGNGTTGYFDFGVTGIAAGLTDATGLLFALVKTAPTGAGFASHLGSTTGVASRNQFYVLADDVYSSMSGGGIVGFSGTRATNTGIWVASRESVTSLELYSRKTAGITKHATDTTDATGSTASPLNISAMAQGAGDIPSDGEYGAYGLGLGLNDSMVSDFTLHLKTLWEGCTGLTLP